MFIVQPNTPFKANSMDAHSLSSAAGRRQPALAMGFVVAISMVTLAAGCRGRSFFPPAGSLNQQQANAIVHDPFPLDDIAPTDLGARPPSYQQPVPEPVRNRLIPDAMPWLGR